MNRLSAFRNITVVVACCLASASCSDVTDEDSGNRLPDGTYPMTFTAAVDGLTATRSTGKDTWTEGDLVAVSTDGGTNSKTYKITNATTGAMEPNTTGDAYYWETTTDVNILAWYPADGATDKDISNQSGGFATFDYLTANKTFQYSANAGELPFKHQMAKVKYTLQKGTGISDQKVSAATVQIYGYTKATFIKGALSGTTNGWITPTSDKEVLVVPQNMDGMKFIKVTTNNNVYFYTPTDNKANLEAGNVYTYTITVTKTGLVVTAGTSASWTEDIQGGENTEATFNVHLNAFSAPANTSDYKVTDADGNTLSASSNIYSTSNEINISLSAAQNYRLKKFLTKVTSGICKQKVNYVAEPRTYTYTFYDFRSDIWLDDIQAEAVSASSTLEAAQVGDYYYADGTWSSSFSGEKPCIGIVFKVESGTGDDIKSYGSFFINNVIHGYVVALQDAYTVKCTFGGHGVLIGTPTAQDDFAGYSNTQLIINKANEGNHLKPDDAVTDYPAAYYISVYGNTAAAPAGSSGWYLPSTGQLREIYKIKDSRSSILNLKTDDYYLSSSEYDRGWIRYNIGCVSFNDGSNYYREKEREPAYVRAVLTF